MLLWELLAKLEISTQSFAKNGLKNQLIATDVIFLSLPKNLQKYRHAAIIAAIILLSALFPQMIFALKRNKLMARKTSTMPTLFKRSNHGCYCFRRVVDSKRTTINTNTTDYTAAKQFLRKYLQGESTTALAVTQNQHVRNGICSISR